MDEGSEPRAHGAGTQVKSWGQILRPPRALASGFSDLFQTGDPFPPGWTPIARISNLNPPSLMRSQDASEPMTIRPYRPADEDAVVALWDRCGLLRPQNDPRKDIHRKLKVSPELFLVGALGSNVIATAMAGYEGHRGWISYLGVDPAFQQRGYGREIVLRAEELLRERGCPKINLQIRASNQEVIDFYHRLGFSIDDVLSMGKRLVLDQTAPDPGSPP